MIYYSYLVHNITNKLMFGSIFAIATEPACEKWLKKCLHAKNNWAKTLIPADLEIFFACCFYIDLCCEPKFVK